MVKVIGIFRRKADISPAEFRDHYENHHIHLFDPYLEDPAVKKYSRRYLTPVAAAITGEVNPNGFDVIMEVWCEREWYEKFFVQQPPEEFRTMIAADEERFLDRASMQIYVEDVEIESRLEELRSEKAGSEK
jgi:hypothetical protein